MKLRALLLALALLAFAAVAQAATPHSVGVNLGLASPGGDVGDLVGTGLVIGANYEYRINPRFGVGLDVDYFSLGEKSSSSPHLGYPRTVKQTAPGGQAILFGRYYIPMKRSTLAPYAWLGLEKVRIGIKSTTTYRGYSFTNTNKQDKQALGLGVGANRELNEQLGVGAELGFHDVQTSGFSTRLLTLALACTYRLGQ